MPQLTTRTTRLLLAGELAAVQRVRTLTLVTTALAAVTGAAAAAAIGPWLLELVFGTGVTLAAGETAVIAAGCVVGVGNLVLMVLAMAQDRPRRVAVVWLAAVAVAVAAFAALVSTTSPLEATAWSFLVAEVAAFAGLAAVPVRPVPARLRA